MLTILRQFEQKILNLYHRVPEKKRQKLSPYTSTIRLALELTNILPRSACYIKYLLSRRGKAAERIEKARQVLGKKSVIHVAFQVTTLAKWKTDSVFELMMQHPRFEPTLWFVPYCRYTEEEISHEYENLHEYAQKRGWRLVRYKDLSEFPTSERPDLTFVHEPYVWWAPYCKGMEEELFCLVPYGYPTINEKFWLDQELTYGALFIFMDSEISAREASEIMANHGENLVVTGHPIGDAMLFGNKDATNVWKACPKPMKKVIWAPHWTFDKKLQRNPFITGTFSETADIMLKIAQNFRDEIQFAFKPHPLLYGELCKHPLWGKERADAYYHLWRDMPNTQLETGVYSQLFSQSDAMIHDSVSFTIEYLLVNKPCMYLANELPYRGFNQIAIRAYECYEKGTTESEITNFLNSVLKGTDKNKAIREDFRNKCLLPPNGVSAAQNIINLLLDPRCPKPNQPLL